MMDSRHKRRLTDQDVSAISMELFIARRRYEDCANQWERIGGADSEQAVRNNRARAEECKRLARVIEGKERSE